LALSLLRARARRDILQNAGYLEDQGGVELAGRFVDATQDTFDALAPMPKAGIRCEFSKPALKRVRRWPVKGFENWLVFYLPRRNGVEILHVIHGARDVESLLNK
jgi:toxin ParE1/3/4